jgi:hypothetical protein
MTPMRSCAVLGLVLALAAGACAQDDPPMPGACTRTDVAGYERALRAAPQAVRLPGGVAISDCLRRVRSDAELQNLGLVVHTVAEELAARARDGRDTAAARSLGYLGGAAAVGAERSSGVSAELARRVSSATVGLETGPPALARALREGRDAGRALG